MQWQPISKQGDLSGVTPNLDDYAAVREGFTWDAMLAELDGLPDGGINIAQDAWARNLGRKTPNHRFTIAACTVWPPRVSAGCCCAYPADSPIH